MTETTQDERDRLRCEPPSIHRYSSCHGEKHFVKVDQNELDALINDADRLAAIERRIENLIDRKKLHADRLREEGKGEHCEGFIDALDDEVDDLIAILDPPT